MSLIFPRDTRSASSSLRGHCVDASDLASLTLSWTSINIPLQPAATADLANVGIMARMPPVVSPSPPGNWAL